MKRTARSWWRGVRWLAAVALVGSCLCLIAFPFGRCSDGNCEGPQTPVSCPEDCGETELTPNPLRAVVSEEILEWRNWVADGGFEEGTSAFILFDPPAERRTRASAERSPDAARSGDFGVRIEAGETEGIVLALRSAIEKGESTRCTFWARSHSGPVELRLSVLGVEAGREDEPRILHTPEPASIEADWTQVRFTFGNTPGVPYALLTIDIGPNMRIDIDDAAVEAEQWTFPDGLSAGRTVGGIPVPSAPAAPVHFDVLIHIEDPALLIRQEEYFREKTAVFSELARVLHEHSGFLTIQPEEDWPMAALRYAPSTLADLAEGFDVVYSTHTHGPAYIDPDGRLRSNQDCNNCRSCPGWQAIQTDTDPYTHEYVEALRDLISEVSGTDVSDHNGNFHYANASALAEAGIATWSAFKDHTTQSTFDRLFTNPWRPTECDAIEDPETFQTHDPTTPVIFVPGWGQAITRSPERIHDRLAPMLSRVLSYADPDRVNTFYIVTHVDHYRSEDEPYIDVDEETGAVTYHEAFLRDLGYWEETLEELIDPLVAEGYLQWTPLPDIGRLFAEWESERRTQ